MVGTDATRIRVLIVDDAPESRRALRKALSFDDAIAVVGEAGDGVEAVDQAESLTPDVVLMDVRMPGGNGVEATRAIASRLPDTHVVALTAHEDADTVRDMLEAGATGYVVKGASVDEVLTAVRAATTGDSTLDDRVLPHAVEDLRRLLRSERTRRAEAERVARTRDEFVHVLSHELRTPLTVMTGALRALEPHAPTRDVTELVARAMARAADLERVIEGLELIGQRRSAASRSNPAGAVAEGVLRTGHRPAVVDLEKADWPGVSNQHLARVAYELVRNAATHGAEPVHITARREGNEGILTVSDAGTIDISPELFRPFSQRDMSTTREMAGMGLGLFVASRLCQAGGGRLDLRWEDGRTVAEARFRLSA
ncbi:MAG TPA: response regulator [Longimicrobiales bacterium]